MDKIHEQKKELGCLQIVDCHQCFTADLSNIEKLKESHLKEEQHFSLREGDENTSLNNAALSKCEKGRDQLGSFIAPANNVLPMHTSELKASRKFLQPNETF